MRRALTGRFVRSRAREREDVRDDGERRRRRRKNTYKKEEKNTKNIKKIQKNIKKHTTAHDDERRHAHAKTNERRDARTHERDTERATTKHTQKTEPETRRTHARARHRTSDDAHAHAKKKNRTTRRTIAFFRFSKNRFFSITKIAFSNHPLAPVRRVFSTVGHPTSTSSFVVRVTSSIARSPVVRRATTRDVFVVACVGEMRETRRT